MEIAKSDIVRSDAGRDQGKLFVVLAVEGEYLLRADGKGRKAESPKRKKRKHVLFVAEDDSRLADKIKRSQLQKQLKVIRLGLNTEKGAILIPFSAETKQGREEIWDLVDQILASSGETDEE